MPENIEIPQFSADQPLLNPADDKLDRNRFSSEIARSLANWRGRDSLIISLSGEWGSGKSTIKNFVIHHLGDKATTVEFNPWQWSGQDKLLEGFLWQLGGVFGKKDIATQTRTLASKWKAFSAITQIGGDISNIGQTLVFGLLAMSAITSLVSSALAAVPWVKTTGLIIAGLLLVLSAITKFIAKIPEALSEWAMFREKTMEELRSEIECELRKLEKPIIVFIDDIDRLTKEEIKLLVQLVKANAQFPNLVYFLLFQKDIVVKALSEITSDDGSKYLRKIVQVEFDVPTASDQQMQKMLVHELEAILSKGDIKIRLDREHWQSIFLDDLWPYFKNLRDIKRFLGSFEFYLALHINEGVLEVNPVDLFAVEVLRMFDHDAFVAISKAFPRGRTSMLALLHEKEEKTNAVAQLIKDITSRATLSDSEKQRLTHLLRTLFPQSTSPDAINNLKRDLRVGDESSFYKYFQVTLDAGKPSAHEITRFVEASSNRDSLVTILRSAIAKSTIEELLDFIFVCREDIPLANMATVATALFDVGDELPAPVESRFSAGLDMQCNRIIYHRLKDEEQIQTTEILWDAFTDTTGFILPVHCLALEDKMVRERGEKTSFLIAEARLSDFVGLIVERIREKAKDLTLLDHKECGFVLYRWANWAGDEEVSAWIKSIVRTPSATLKLLNHLMSKSIINGTIERPYLNGKAVERMIPLETLDDALNGIPAETLKPIEVLNVKLLAKARRLKSEGKDYSEVRSDDSTR